MEPIYDEYEEDDFYLPPPPPPPPPPKDEYDPELDDIIGQMNQLQEDLGLVNK